jgi:hypothetical protein
MLDPNGCWIVATQLQPRLVQIEAAHEKRNKDTDNFLCHL